MSDEELDNLFKEAAEGFKIKEDPSAWNDMSARLDEGVQPTSFWNWKSFSGLALIGFTGVLIFWYISSFESDPMSQSLTSSQSVTSKNKMDGTVKIQSSEMNHQNKEDFHPGNKAFEETERKKSTKPDFVTPLSEPHAHLPKQGAVKINDLTKSPSNSKRENQINEQSQGTDNTFVALDLGAASKEKVYFEGENQRSEGYLIKTEQKNNQGLALKDSTATGIMPLNNFPVDSVAREIRLKSLALKTDSLSSTSEISTNKISSSGQRFSIKLSVSPDFSSIKLSSPSKSGINFGVLLGYNFNERWSISTGAILSRKIYSSTEIDESYTSAGGYDYPVYQLDGDCRVLDIPLNVYYGFNQGHSLSFKVGLGVSSYLMLSEDYTYYVDNPYGSDVYSQSIIHENNEWFKMVNMSVAVQKKLSNRFYIELEPFLKIPITSIGEGDVSLVSMGAFVNLQYNFNLILTR